MSKIKICCVTGTRADYPRIRPVLRILRNHPNFDLSLIVTGSHLLKRFGNTIDEIYADGFDVAHKVDMYTDDFDHPVGMAKSAAKAMMGLAEAYHEVAPDLMLLTVDRVETLAAASAASLMNFPIAHVQGGEVTGTIDESIRHAVTKMSHYHFAANEDAVNRIVRMGELPENVFNTGCPYVDELLSYKLIPLEVLAEKYQFSAEKPLAIFTQHAVTTEYGQSADQIKATLRAIEGFDLSTIAIFSNADAGGQVIIEELKNQKNFSVVANMRSDHFASLMAHAKVMIGNSSAGLREAPSFGLPAVNIGSRQAGRLRGNNVIDVPHDTEAISAGIDRALKDTSFRNLVAERFNPYGDGDASEKIVELLCDLDISPAVIQKKIAY